MTRVKICGLTREDDVRHAAALGAWACGFVLSPSPRRVTPARARTLCEAARLGSEASADGSCPHPLTVAVVTTESPSTIARWLDETGCGAVQLSAGARGPAVAAARAAAERLGLHPLVIAAADTPGAADADFLLVDGRLPGRYGGTGRSADWAAAASRAADGRLVLAGGLTPRRVAEAIAAVRPMAVDVASGLEATPGVKERGAVAAFFAAVAAADHRLAGDAGASLDGQGGLR